MYVMLPVDVTMIVMCHVFFACGMHVHDSGCLTTACSPAVSTHVGAL